MQPLPYASLLCRSAWKSSENHPQVSNYRSIMASNNNKPTNENIICFLPASSLCLLARSFKGKKLHFILFLRVFNLTFSFFFHQPEIISWSEVYLKILFRTNDPMKSSFSVERGDTRGGRNECFDAEPSADRIIKKVYTKQIIVVKLIS